ncbi:MAG: CYTH domain-containing protein [Gemmatimonadota bacterium]
MKGLREYELKTRLREPAEFLRERLKGAGWRVVFAGEMRDRRYDTSGADLEARDEVLRLRRYVDTKGRVSFVLGWKGPASMAAGFKLREELETRVEHGDRVGEILARLGYPEITIAIDRRIEIYEKDEVTVRIEEYPRMDVLIEIEGEPARVNERVPELGIPREQWSSASLAAFVDAYERRTGRKAILSLEDR